jgi:hypothetical protein
MGLGHLAGEFHRPGVDFLDPGAGVTELGFQGTDAFIDLGLVIPPHDDLERLVILVAGHYVKTSSDPHGPTPRHGTS